MNVKILKPIIPDIYVRIKELILEDQNVSADFKKALEASK
jgi:hypothetical protein